MLPIIVFIFLIPLGLAGTLLFRGFRGLRIGDHPVCCRCGFDLYGQPAGTVICGECGNDLKQPNSVTIGHHHRQPNLIIAGAVILCPILFVAAVFIWGQASDIHWLGYAPTRFVIWRGSSADPGIRSPAIAELGRRLTAGTLDSGDLQRVADAALGYQADLSKPWDPGWGDWLENCQANGKLSDAQWKQYLAQASNGAFGLRLRQKVYRGDGLPFSIERRATRAGEGMKLEISFDPSGFEWLSPHGPMPAVPHLYPLQTSLYGSGMASPSKLPFENFPLPVPDGLQQVHITGEVRVGFPGKTWHIDPIVSSKIDLRGAFMLIPNSQRPAKTSPADVTAAVRNSIHVRSVYLTTGNQPELYVELSVNAPPLPLALLMYARSSGQEVSLGGAAYPAHMESNSSMLVHTTWLGANPGKVDLIFRDNPDWVGQVGDWDGEDGWKGEIVLKEVPVK